MGIEPSIMSALYGFAYSETALRFLETSVPPKIRRRIKNKVESLASNATRAGSKKLQGKFDGEISVYRIRSGDYRILYTVRSVIIVILDIGHRKDVYR